MEENKKKLTYEELEQKANEVFQANQQMQAYIGKMQERLQQMQGALEDKSFNTMSFFISMLFKVIEHPDMYKPEFVEWCVENVQSALISFANEIKSEPEGEKVGSKSDEKTDEKTK